MFGTKKNNLNATLQRVTGFIKELEDGIAANKETVIQNIEKVDSITETADQEATRILDLANEKCQMVSEANAILLDQNTAGQKLLAKFQ